MNVSYEGFDLPKFLLHECFTYAYGNLYWKSRPLGYFKNQRVMNNVNSRVAGLRVGCVRDGYLWTTLLGKNRAVHSIVYAMHHGPFVGIIDHIDGNPLNNRIENLRVTDRSGNTRNRAINARNRTGYKGASKVGNSYLAKIGVGKKSLHLGSFTDAESAHKAYCQAADHYFGEFSCHGRIGSKP